MLLETKVKVYRCCHNWVLIWSRGIIQFMSLDHGFIQVCNEGHRTKLDHQMGIWVRLEKNRFARKEQTH
jgi:hypothetical protein